MRRPTIAVGLPPSERDDVVQQLTEAEFGTVILEHVDELAPALLAGLPIGLVILDATADPRGLADTLSRLRADGVTVPALIVAEAAQFDVIHDGGFGPDDEVALRPVDPDGIRWRAEAMLIRAQVVEQADGGVMSRGPVEAGWASRSPIVAIFNPKGGVGKTTIATNLAAALQQRRDRRVLLVDADTVTGHVGLSLGMDAGRTMVDAWRDQDDGGPAEGILDFAATHASGIRVAELVSNPLAMPLLNAERVAENIMAARWGVDVIVVDLHPSYSEVNQTIFGIADRILVPVTPDLPAIRAAVQLGEVADELGVRNRLGMVVNRANSGVSVKQMEEAVGLTSLATIRSGGMLFVRAANVGRTVTDMFPKDPVSLDFEALADRVLGLEATGSGAEADKRRTSILSGLFGRKRADQANQPQPTQPMAASSSGEA